MSTHSPLIKYLCFIIAVMWWGNASPLPAQTGAENTLLTIEIMLPPIVGDPLQAQRWGRFFQKLGESSRIRQPLPSDEPEIKEQNRGPIRILTLIGELDRKGTLHFPGKSFTMNDEEEIKAWLNELKVYGAQGSPDGKKFWGLNEVQFGNVVKGVTKAVDFSTEGKPLGVTIHQLPIEKSLPIVVHPTAKQAYEEATTTIVKQELQGLSSGTALAVILRDAGFGFRPLRTPAGSIELTVESLTNVQDAWPVGWDIDDSKPPGQVIPNLFKFVKTGFEEAPLGRVLDAIADQTRTPILIDLRHCQQKEIDVETVGVSYPEKQTAWSVILKSVVGQARLHQKYRLDEAGKPFVWVAPFVPYTPVKR